LETIRTAVLGEGHFLGAAQTHAAMERDYLYPKLADRDDPRTWAMAGARDSWARAGDRARDILNTHHPQYLTADQEAQIRLLLPLW
ncbi:MAG: trimethylamine methyltransferase family protein, partial [Paracoccaceae bacterium]